MEVRVFEASQGPNGPNWGKFATCRFDEAEWALRSAVAEGDPLLRACGWTRDHVWLLDLQTGEGALFRPGGYAPADLDKHRVWVCVLYQAVLEALYARRDWLEDFSLIPAVVELPEAPGGLWGHRRKGPV